MYTEAHNRIIRKSALLFAGLFLLFTSCFDSDEIDFDAQLASDLATIDKYLTDNGITALQDPDNQIRYVIHEEGTGITPVLTNCIRATYEGRTLDTDKKFTSGFNYAFPLAGDVIEGWKIGVPLLQAGDSVSFYIPSVLAYGPSGIPEEGIDPNVNVVFHFELKYVGKAYSASPSPDGTCN
jgi:FKBP-type peptidyl-prolyl cis-trans isomerase FkpA